jgi:hypothetical protein
MKERWMPRVVRDNALSLAMLILFIGPLLGQSGTGHRVYNQDQLAHGEPEISYRGYLGTGHFVESVFENWESEFLQMAMYVLLTAVLIQKGSAESKKGDGSDPQDEDPRHHQADREAPLPVRKGGLALRLYEHSLSIALFALFLMSFILHAAGGAKAYSAEQVAHGGNEVRIAEYLTTSQFWFESLQNWQSEFLSVLAIVVLSIFLRQRGSPESKPVHAPHMATGND